MLGVIRDGKRAKANRMANLPCRAGRCRWCLEATLRMRSTSFAATAGLHVADADRERTGLHADGEGGRESSRCGHQRIPF